MLLATSDDKTASVWNVPYGATWPSAPHVTFKGHTGGVEGGAFLGDESHVITGSKRSSRGASLMERKLQTTNVDRCVLFSSI